MCKHCGYDNLYISCAKCVYKKRKLQKEFENNL